MAAIVEIADPQRSAFTLSQKKMKDDSGATSYCVVVVRDDGAELAHEYCLYHPQAGPVRPDPVRNLRLESNGIVKWEWSENSFDLASPGAHFERRLEEGQLAWAGPVVRTPKQKPLPALPVDVGATAAALRKEDVHVRSEHKSVDGTDEVRVHISHAPTGSSLIWEGQSTAESQSVSQFKTSAVKGLVMVEFVYRTAEDGNRHAYTEALFVKLGGSGLEWVEAQPR